MFEEKIKIKSPENSDKLVVWVGKEKPVVAVGMDSRAVIPPIPFQCKPPDAVFYLC